jgi:hypothetical protein
MLVGHHLLFLRGIVAFINNIYNACVFIVVAVVRWSSVVKVFWKLLDNSITDAMRMLFSGADIICLL